MCSCSAVHLVLCLSLGSHQHASSTDDNDDLLWMKRQLTDVIDLTNTTIDLSQSYDGNHTVSKRDFRTLESFLNYIISPAEDFIRHIELEENGKWDQAEDPSKTFKSYAWTKVRSMSRLASDPFYVIVIGQAYAVFVTDQTAISKWGEQKKMLQAYKPS